MKRLRWNSWRKLRKSQGSSGMKEHVRRFHRTDDRCAERLRWTSRVRFKSARSPTRCSKQMTASGASSRGGRTGE